MENMTPEEAARLSSLADHLLLGGLLCVALVFNDTWTERLSGALFLALTWLLFMAIWHPWPVPPWELALLAAVTAGALVNYLADTADPRERVVLRRLAERHLPPFFFSKR